MTVTEMFGQSAIVTLLGMGVVFGFLIILIICITLVGNAVHSLGLDKDLEKPVKAKSPIIPEAVPVIERTNNDAITAVIAAAITTYRKTPS